MKQGYFITFEGSDGAGKSTQLDLLAQALEMHGFNVLRVREPGGTPIGEKIRHIFKDPNLKEMCPETELFLVNAARAQLVREVIKPALEAGKVVLCDRYYHSTVLYQAFGRGLDQNMVKATIQFAIDGVVPDVTFLLFLEREEAKKRSKLRGAKDRLESDQEAFFDRIQQGIDWMKENASNKLVPINANDSKENLANEIYRCTAARISELAKSQLSMKPLIVGADGKEVSFHKEILCADITAK
jgi:dTMP kinase